MLTNSALSDLSNETGSGRNAHLRKHARWTVIVLAAGLVVAILFTLLGRVFGAVPTAGLVGHWSFNEGSGTTAADGSGNSLNGTLTNGPIRVAAGQCIVGGCLSFDGSNDYVRILDSPLLKLNGSITISAWIKPTLTSTAQTAVSKRTEFQLGPTQLTAPYGLSWSQRQTNGATITGPLINATENGIWQHVVLVRNGATKTVTGYKNGVLELNSTYAQTPNTSTYNLTIGRRASGGEYFKGLVDEVRVYNRILTGAEIGDLYTESGNPPPQSDTEAPSVPTNLTATAASLSQINLSWTASTDNQSVAGYRIYRDGSQIATSASVSYQDTGLAPSTTYSYTVAAYDPTGNVSAQSAAASATTFTGPPQRQDVSVASGFTSPTSMALAPDGRIFVAEQAGNLRVVKNDALLPTPFVSLPAVSNNERGLLGIAFDPNYAQNRYVYLYYTFGTETSAVNRLSRFTADLSNPDVATSGSETVILDNLPSQTGWHNGGAIHFGGDGKLYVAVGEGHASSNAQLLTTYAGKLLRIDPSLYNPADPSAIIPADNPFNDAAGPNKDGIWAYGLRNPFTFDIQPATGRIFINDVGENAWEEINEAWIGPNNGSNAGFNFGWPTTEGPTTDSRFKTPFHAYPQSATDCAITGGSFYNPVTVNFPTEYVGDYFFADYCDGWIKNIDLTTKVVTVFIASDRTRDPVDVKVSDDGSLYYIGRGAGASGGLHRVNYTGTNQPPAIVSQPQNAAIPIGGSATFSVSASGAAPLSYQWQRDGSNIVGATAFTYTINNAQIGDNGAQFRVVVTNSVGTATSNAAILTVTTNTPPTGTINTPADAALYSAGEIISYTGTGNDTEDGALGGAAFTWKVDFHHDDHTHPFIPDTTGSSSGSFTIPTIGETSSNVWYRIYLTVRDSGGLTHTSFRDITPRRVNLTLTTNVSGVQLNLDGQPVNTPHTVNGVVGVTRTINAPSPQTVGGITYEFVSWSDGGVQSHTISTPSTDTTYTAAYQQIAGPPPLPTLGLLGYWAFDEGSGTTTGDSSSNGNSGTLQYGPLWAGLSSCKIGNCLSFDGTDDYVRILDTATLQITGDITISAWIKPTDPGLKAQSIVSKRYEFEVGPTKTTAPYAIDWFQKQPNGTAVTGPLTSSTAANEWQHIVLVRDGVNRQITGYKNGVAGATTVYAMAPGTSSYNVNIGRHAAGGQQFKGLIDEVRIYNRVLNPAEIGQLYGQTDPAAASLLSLLSLQL